MTLFELFLKGGSIMWAILAVSILGAAIIVQKFITLWRVRVDAGKFILQIRSVMTAGDTNAAIALCTEAGTPLANILRSGLLKMRGSHQDVKDAVESAARMEVYKLERGLGLLASVAGIAPLLGFLGTVTGMIAAFRMVEMNEGVVNPTLLASGIWEALLTTAVGLCVAIPFALAHSLLENRIERFHRRTEDRLARLFTVSLYRAA